MTDEIGPAREAADIRVSAIVVGLTGILAFVVVTVFGFYSFYRAKAPSASLAPPRNFPAPQLQTRSDDAREPSIAQQQAKLSAYAWIDRNRGIVQIPIDRAMALIAARGDKAYDPIATTSGAAQP